MDKVSISEIKAAAQSDLEALAEESGDFRRSRIKTKLHHDRHGDRNASAHNYGTHLHCFSCGERFDAIDLEQRARGGSPGDAIRRLAERYGLKPARTGYRRPRITTEAIAKAELFRTGLTWRIEQALEVVKRHLWTEAGHKDAEDACRRLTEHLNAVRAWSTRRLRLQVPLTVSCLNSVNTRAGCCVCSH